MRNYSPKACDRGAHKDNRENKRKGEKRALQQEQGVSGKKGLTLKHAGKILSFLPARTKSGALMDFMALL